MTRIILVITLSMNITQIRMLCVYEKSAYTYVNIYEYTSSYQGDQERKSS